MQASFSDIVASVMDPTVFLVSFLLLGICESAIPTSYDEMPLYPFGNLGDVVMLHYSVPPEIGRVTWQFLAQPDAASCPQLDTKIVLQHDSFPLVNPDGAAVPPSVVLDHDDRFEMSVAARHDSNQTLLFHLFNPLPGDWFAASWLPPSTDKRYHVSGLTHQCQWKLKSVATWSMQEKVRPILTEKPYTETLSSKNPAALFKYGACRQLCLTLAIYL